MDYEDLDLLSLTTDQVDDIGEGIGLVGGILTGLAAVIIGVMSFVRLLSGKE